MWITDLRARATFGEGWSQLESCSPVLRKLPVLVRDLTAEMRAARMILDALDRRDAKVTRVATAPADSPECGVALALSVIFANGRERCLGRHDE